MAKRGYVDTEMARRGMWLVKVPRYLSEIWEANAGNEVGRIVVPPPSDRNQTIKLMTKQGLAMPAESQVPAGGQIPDDHTFITHPVKDQTMAVVAEDKTGLAENASTMSGRLSVEGRVVQRCECRPVSNPAYLKMKINHIQQSTQPKRFVQLLDKAAVKFKPVSQHEEDMQRIRQKKDGAKTTRADRDVVIAALFHAFEKHQYYRLQDLQQLTQQPAGYVKELLQEIAVYNAAPPHKSMWELKPEYRNYRVMPETPQS